MRARGLLPGWLARVLGDHQILLVNAGSLFGATLLTGGLGAVYWAIAARLFPPAAVGVGAAAISSMQLLAQLATFGLGTMLMGELAEHRASDRRLIVSSLGVTVAVGAVIGLVFVLVSGSLIPGLGGLRSAAGIVLFGVGVAVSAAGLVLDQALVGLLRGWLQLLRNGIASVAKLVILVAVGGLAVSLPNGLPILVTWVGGSLLSMVVLVGLPASTLDRPGRSVWRAMEGVAGLAIRHHLLNLSILAPGLLLPLLITAILSPEANAYFYVAYLIASFAWALPAAMGTAGYAAGSRDIESLPGRIRVTFWTCIAAGVALNVVLLVGAPLLLSVFGAAYADQATTLLRLLGLGIFPVTLNSLYVPIARVERRFLRGAALNALGLVVEFAFVALGAMDGGLTGAGIGWLIGYTLGIVPFLPTIIRVGVRGRVERISDDLLGRVPSGLPGRSGGGVAAAAAPPVAPGDRRRPWPIIGERLVRHADWSIGVVDRPIDAFLADPATAGPGSGVRWLPGEPGTFAADPFGVERDGILHVFFERFVQDRGRGFIAHRAFGRDGSPVSPATTILDLACHASYPFLVEADGELWIVPETSDLAEVRLYRAVDFPTGWALEATILEHTPVSDPTIVRHDDRWWLFGTSRGRGVNESLRLWHADRLTGPWRLHDLDPVKTDRSSARPGGTPFRDGERLLRPAQDNARRYGGRLVVNEVVRLSPSAFEERVVATIEPLDAAHPDGVHTLSAVGGAAAPGRTLVDGNAMRFIPAAFRHELQERFRPSGQAARERR